VMSAMQKKGFLLWEKHANELGGVLGRPVEVRILDNRGDLELLQKHYTDMLEGDGIDLVFAPYSSQQTEKVAPLFEKHRVPVLASGASAPSLWEQGYQYLFGLYTPADFYSQGFLEIMSIKDINQLAIFYSEGIFPASSAQGARKWARRLGLDVVLFEQMGTDAALYLNAVLRARQNRARSVMMFGYLREAVLMRRALDEADWDPAAYYAAVGPVSRDYLQELGDLAENTFSTAPWIYHSGLVYPGVHRFNADFQKTYGQRPGYHAATAYAAGQLMASALDKTGELDKEKLRKVLMENNAFTILGRYGVNSKGGQMRHSAFTIQWRGQEQEIVWPPSLSTSQPWINYER
ncbi:MAG: amino acid ABC transporter substrate-binding protein, partial [Desulfonatronovibrionaceae bacterium]